MTRFGSWVLCVLLAALAGAAFAQGTDVATRSLPIRGGVSGVDVAAERRIVAIAAFDLERSEGDISVYGLDPFGYVARHPLPGGVIARHLRLSPDGERLLFVGSCEADRDLACPPSTDGSGVFALDLETGEVETVIPADRVYLWRDPTWGPEGDIYVLGTVFAESSELAYLTRTAGVFRVDSGGTTSVVFPTRVVAEGATLRDTPGGRLNHPIARFTGVDLLAVSEDGLTLRAFTALDIPRRTDQLEYNKLKGWTHDARITDFADRYIHADPPDCEDANKVLRGVIVTISESSFDVYQEPGSIDRCFGDRAPRLFGPVDFAGQVYSVETWFPEQDTYSMKLVTWGASEISVEPIMFSRKDSESLEGLWVGPEALVILTHDRPTEAYRLFVVEAGTESLVVRIRKE